MPTSAPMKLRIVSLLPGATELVCALGARGSLVGRSHECDFPDTIRHLPALTAPEVDPAASSAVIDTQVRAAVEAGRPLFRIDAAALKGLRPDVILTQAQCAVCAVSRAELDAVLADWPGPAPEVVALNPSRFADLWKDFTAVAEALRLPDLGREWIVPHKERVAEVITRVASGVTRRPKVLALEWLDPLMSGGNWLPEMVELAGGTAVLAQAGEPSPWIDWDSVRKADPDVLVLLPCGFDLARARSEAAALTGLPGWNTLRAVRNGRVFVVDGNALFNRPGPRLVDSLECLAEMLHPTLFPARHRGTGWQPL